MCVWTWFAVEREKNGKKSVKRYFFQIGRFELAIFNRQALAVPVVLSIYELEKKEHKSSLGSFPLLLCFFFFSFILLQKIYDLKVATAFKNKCKLLTAATTATTDQLIVFTIKTTFFIFFVLILL